ncbi:hypothetical protein [Streptomyces sp. ME19-01-6]|uniref:hypothetical protein n=1 Tax=Streptomyces sp. ME19-01-6 TaxID=3028686 RepID=UPI0029B03F51|nr:hypothetical protein [Streptomyces sp. ME19-01-6]MDX3228763.1 hypothetical protein [Streptomyces sp. ME19-01-6]
MTEQPPPTPPAPQGLPPLPAGVPPQPGQLPAAVPVAPPQPRGRISLRNPLVSAAIGLVVGLAAVGIPVLLSDDDGGGGFGGGGGRGELSAPAKLDGLRPLAEIQRSNGVAKAEKNADGITKDERKSGERLSEAYGGAAAVMKQYADGDGQTTVTLTAVRSRSPEPYVTYVDPKRLGLVKPLEELKTFGDVSCVLYNQPTNAGSEPAADSVHVTYCQRTGDGLTVQIRPAGSGVANRPEKVADIVNAAWSEMS